MAHPAGHIPDPLVTRTWTRIASNFCLQFIPTFAHFCALLHAPVHGHCSDSKDAHHKQPGRGREISIPPAYRRAAGPLHRIDLPRPADLCSQIYLWQSFLKYSILWKSSTSCVFASTKDYKFLFGSDVYALRIPCVHTHLTVLIPWCYATCFSPKTSPYHLHQAYTGRIDRSCQPEYGCNGGQSKLQRSLWRVAC